jgi:hypothetical protein
MTYYINVFDKINRLLLWNTTNKGRTPIRYFIREIMLQEEEMERGREERLLIECNRASVGR